MIAPGAAPGSAGNTSPYTVELIGERGDVLPTYEAEGRFYVLGDAGERYSVHVRNPTNRRVEAVVSVDGLDVIDGETADFASKRGYVIPAGSEVRIDGWRVSTSQVAAFRFSSVRTSYAGRKGQPRNVGVIGVALFAERAQPQMIVPQPQPYPNRRRTYDDDYPPDAAEEGADGDAAEPVGGSDRPAPPPTTRSGGGAHITKSRPREDCCGERRIKKDRAGLGTAYGEHRHSQVMWTRFEREHPTRPTAIAELRYNDATGLAALGIPIDAQLPDEGELVTRETADPFPGRFSRPPQ